MWVWLLAVSLCLLEANAHHNRHSMDRRHHEELHEDNNRQRKELKELKGGNHHGGYHGGHGGHHGGHDHHEHSNHHHEQKHNHQEGYFPGNSLVHIGDYVTTKVSGQNCKKPAHNLHFRVGHRVILNATTSEQDLNFSFSLIDKRNNAVCLVWLTTKTYPLYAYQFINKQQENFDSGPYTYLNSGRPFTLEFKIEENSFEIFLDGNRKLSYKQKPVVNELESFMICSCRHDKSFLDVKGVTVKGK